MEKREILKEGRNCWRIVSSDRATFLVDGEAYFSAFAEAMEHARQQVLIVGWDVDSRIRLHRDGKDREFPTELGSFLNELVRRRKGLRIHILDWDFTMLYALDREPLPIFKLGWRTHRRLSFAMDDKHPVGASHHQKIVVIDDRLAFAGGFDLARKRWDTSSHAIEDERRCDNGKPYPPFHDIQMLLDGEAAASLGELARHRWHRATGERLTPPRNDSSDPWPDSVRPDLWGISVAVARTEPEYDGHPEVCEVKQLYLDAIASARSSIYIENQYLTSPAVGDALADRLREEDGPEVVIVLPKGCSGWLEEASMGVLRARLLRRLRDADRFGRLKTFYPVIRGKEEIPIYVHAKVVVVDNALVQVGSANLNNRSMGLDTECVLAVDGGDKEEIRQRIARFRNRLLAEHLGTTAEELEGAIEQRKSLGAAIDAMGDGVRALVPLVPEVEEWLEDMVPESAILDPERPVDMEKLIDELIPAKESRGVGKGMLLVILVGTAFALAAAWRWTPLGEWVDVEAAISWGRRMEETPAVFLLVLSAFIVGGLVMFPVTILILVAIVTFGPLAGSVYAMVGSVSSALLTFGIGRFLGKETIRKYSGGRLNRISRYLARRGVVAVSAVRLLPIAPFTVVNLVAGASHIRLRDYLLGTLLGMTPGIVAIGVFGKGLMDVIEKPETGNVLLFFTIVAGIGGGIGLLRRWITARDERYRTSSTLSGDEDG